MSKSPRKFHVLARIVQSGRVVGVLTSATIAPLVLASNRPDASFDNLMATGDEEGSFRHHAYRNGRYRKQLESLLPFYDELECFS